MQSAVRSIFSQVQYILAIAWYNLW